MLSFWKNQNLKHVIQWDHVLRTMLMEFLKICSLDEEARGLLYREFPEYYVWNKQTKLWSKRKSRQVIGHVNVANPIEGKTYYLRLF